MSEFVQVLAKAEIGTTISLLFHLNGRSTFALLLPSAAACSDFVLRVLKRERTLKTKNRQTLEDQKHSKQLVPAKKCIKKFMSH